MKDDSIVQQYSMGTKSEAITEGGKPCLELAQIADALRLPI